MRYANAALLAASASLAFAGPTAVALSTATTPPVVEAPAGAWRTALDPSFLPGEEMTFVVGWGVIHAGEATLAVGKFEPINGRAAYHIIAAAHTIGAVDAFFKVRDENDSWLDAGALVSVRYARHIHEGKYRIDEETNIDQTRHTFALHAYRADKNKTEDKQGTVPPNVLDVLGSFYYLRTLPLVVGKSYQMDVLSGDKTYPLQVDVVRREAIDTPAGHFHCLLLEPKLRHPGIFISKGKKLEVWVTDDYAHRPVRMRCEVYIGHVSAELTQFSIATK